jgi:hypothetical protein
MGDASQIDMGGNTLVVNGLRVGATAPGQAGTELTGTQIALLDGLTAGTVTASKAVVVDSSKNIGTFGTVTAGTLVGGVQLLSGPGAVNLTTLTTIITTTGSDAITLADGTNGQLKIIIHGTDGGAATITPTTLANGDTLTMSEAGDSVMLVFATTTGWHIVSNNGTVVG